MWPWIRKSFLASKLSFPDTGKGKFAQLILGEHWVQCGASIQLPMNDFWSFTLLSRESTSAYLPGSTNSLIQFSDAKELYLIRVTFGKGFSSSLNVSSFTKISLFWNKLNIFFQLRRSFWKRVNEFSRSSILSEMKKKLEFVQEIVQIFWRSSLCVD